MTNTENTLLHKNPSTGHAAAAAGHEVHLCHRCGWPFPNPHPSARHRRAHKRVCGTIEGYAITQPKSDDDDDHSDDDHHHTPSPAVTENANAKETGISGVGKMSIKSEDEVFSDAINEFSDGGSGISPRPVDKIDENTTLDQTVDKAQLNGSTSIHPVSDSAATVDAKEHTEGVTSVPEPISVEECTELQPGVVKSEIPRDVAVDANVQTGEDNSALVNLASDEGKALDHVTEVVKHDTSVIGYDLNGVGDEESKDKCSLEVVPDTPVAPVEDDQTTGIIVEDINVADKAAHAEPLESVSENGGVDTTTTLPEQVSNSVSSVPEFRDEDSEKPSEQTHEILAKSGVDEVEPVDIAETVKELAPVITGSELVTESCDDESNGTSGGVAGTSEPPLPMQKHFQESPSIEDRAYEDASSAELTSVDNAVVSDLFSFTPPPLVSATIDDNDKVVGDNLKSLQDESDIKLTKENGGISTVDRSNHSTATSDSMEVNCGSVSEIDFQETKTTYEKRDSKKSDDFEPPSFVTLVQNGENDDKVQAASEIETVQNNQELKSDALKAAWFPSLTNVVNESEGRKKNEEKIAKVTNWSPGRQHGPLKNLLNDAKSPNTKQNPATDHKDEETVKDNGAVSTKANCGPDTEGSKEMDKEWDSPARYPIETKKQKKKGKPFWISFACCSSVHREL